MPANHWVLHIPIKGDQILLIKLLTEHGPEETTVSEEVLVLEMQDHNLVSSNLSVVHELTI